MEKKLAGNSAKKILKAAVFLYVASFLIINWSDVSWLFNYKEMSGLISDFFNPYPSISASAMDAYFYPNHSQNTKTVAQTIENIVINYTDKQNTLEIPKIAVSLPIIFSTTTDKNVLMNDLNSGVVYYPGSVYPGQAGQIVVLGHSAPAGWPKVRHDWAFSDIDKLSPGDKILIDLNNRQYTYVVTKKTIIQRGADVPNSDITGKENVLTLISCWPPGKDYQRIAVEAKLLKE